MRALISVYDKTGVLELVRGLDDLGFDVVASDGTAAHLEEHELPVTRVGDVTDVPELKMARLAQAHGEVVAANIRALLTGADLTVHEPSPDMLVLPLGPKGGASYGPDFGVLGAAQTAGIKGGDLFVGYYRDVLNLDPEGTPPGRAA